jgi:hypothetical protein
MHHLGVVSIDLLHVEYLSNIVNHPSTLEV